MFVTHFGRGSRGHRSGETAFAGPSSIDASSSSSSCDGEYGRRRVERIPRRGDRSRRRRHRRQQLTLVAAYGSFVQGGESFFISSLFRMQQQDLLFSLLAVDREEMDDS